MSKNKIVPILIIGCMIVLLIISSRKESIRNETMVEQNLRTVVIEDVRCTAGSKKGSVYFYDNNEIHRVFVGSGKCIRLNSGDEIAVYYNFDNGYYFYKDDGLRNENNIMSITAIVFIFISIGYLAYSWRRKKT